MDFYIFTLLHLTKKKQLVKKPQLKQKTSEGFCTWNNWTIVSLISLYVRYHSSFHSPLFLCIQKEKNIVPIKSGQINGKVNPNFKNVFKNLNVRSESMKYTR